MDFFLCLDSSVFLYAPCVPEACSALSLLLHSCHPPCPPVSPLSPVTLSNKAVCHEVSAASSHV